jgi:hypothetical protein
MSRLSYLMSLTPRETWRIVRRRMPGLRSGRAWTAEELLSSPKHSRGIRFAELLMRQEAVVRRHVPGWLPPEFENKRVVEVGCGPLGGFGPLVIFCGAASFESAEPEWDPALFFSEPVAEKYMRVFHADLSALYGPRMTFCEFKALLRERMHVDVGGFETSSIRGPVDVVLSQSVLEHVFPLEATLSKLAAIQGPATRFLHLVDFGNHYPTENPFEGLYDQPAAAYIARRGKAINCLRVSDIADIFSSAGIDAHVIPSRVMVDGYRGAIHPWWRERYAEPALFTQLAIVANTQ